VARTSGDYPARLSGFTAAARGAFHPVRYGRDASQFGELWRASRWYSPQPVAVLIHGGFWRAAYRLDLMHALAADLCARGYAVWNLEYRRAGNGGGWPATFTDVAAGLDLLPELARRYRLDLHRVTVIGHSAGGHLALWAAARRRLPSAWRRPQVIPAQVVSLAGVCDLVWAAQQHLSNDAVAGLLGGGPAEAPEVYRQACPKLLLPLGVRQTLVHGDRDENVPPEASGRYTEAARAAGDSCTLLTVPGADHFDLIDPASAAWATVAGRVLRLVP
jgi:acetyl esterase/lipase